MICSKHGVPMPAVPETPRQNVMAPLRRCPKCTVEFRAAFDKARRGPKQFVKDRVVKQRVLPPVIMSERWP